MNLMQCSLRLHVYEYCLTQNQERLSGRFVGRAQLTGFDTGRTARLYISNQIPYLPQQRKLLSVYISYFFCLLLLFESCMLSILL